MRAKSSDTHEGGEKVGPGARTVMGKSVHATADGHIISLVSLPCWCGETLPLSTFTHVTFRAFIASESQAFSPVNIK